MFLKFQTDMVDSSALYSQVVVGHIIFSYIAERGCVILIIINNNCLLL